MSKKTVRRVQRVFQAICAAGLLLLLGSAGAVDLEVIGLGQFLAQGGAGLAMFAVGAWLGGLLA